MALTGINSEDRLVQQPFAEHLRDALGWEIINPCNAETFRPAGTLGGAAEMGLAPRRDLSPPGLINREIRVREENPEL